MTHCAFIHPSSVPRAQSDKQRPSPTPSPGVNGLINGARLDQQLVLGPSNRSFRAGGEGGKTRGAASHYSGIWKWKSCSSSSSSSYETCALAHHLLQQPGVLGQHAPGRRSSSGRALVSHTSSSQSRSVSFYDCDGADQPYVVSVLV